MTNQMLKNMVHGTYINDRFSSRFVRHTKNVSLIFWAPLHSLNFWFAYIFRILFRGSSKKQWYLFQKFCWPKFQLISKAIYGLLTSPKKWMNEFAFLSWRLGNTWNLNFDFWVVRIEKQICLFVFWEKLRLDNFVSRSTDLYH